MHWFRVLIISFIVATQATALYSYDTTFVDSLNRVLPSANDSVKGFLLADLAESLFQTSPLKAKEHAEDGLKYASKLKDRRLEIRLNVILGKIEKNAGNYAGALQHHQKALRYLEEKKDVRGMAVSFNDIGIIYKSMKKLDIALNYYRRSLACSRQINFDRGIINTLNNIGTIFNERNQSDSALYYYQLSLKKSTETDNAIGMGNALNNIGEVYARNKDLDNALLYFKKTLEVDKKTSNLMGSTYTLVNIGDILMDQGNYKEAIVIFNDALSQAKEMNALLLVQGCYKSLSIAYERSGDFKKSLEYERMHGTMNDSLLNLESSEQIAEMETRFNTEKKDKEIQLLNKDKELQNAELNRQRSFVFIVSLGLIIVLGFSFLTYRNYKIKKQDNEKLALAYNEIEEKNKDITDSINYAKRIQEAILTPVEQIRQVLKDIFILYLPKDIVSGDFYYYAEKDGKVIIAVADCTGHGVPGAFMSLIGNDVLNHIILEKGVTTPNEVLSLLHDGVRISLKQDSADSSSTDGMDVGLCCWDPSSNQLQYSGALRNMYLLKGGDFEEIKADKHSIGGVKSSEKKVFTNHKFTLSQGDSFYLSSDGYADQFGGPQGKKFMTKRLKEVIVSSKELSMQKQEESLRNAHVSWKGELKQVDDICVIGVRV